MRKNLCLMLALLALLSLCACGGEPAQPTELPQPTETVQPTETPTPTAAPETPAETQAPGEADSLLEAAQACIDQPVETLYAAIGQPQSSDYAPSCLEVGGEDGNLYYEGFTVYTLRTAEGETVIFVE